MGCAVLVIAPSTAGREAPAVADVATVVRLPALPIASYSDIRIAVGGTARIRGILAEFAPDVVHLASPFELGWRAARAAKQLGIPRC